MTHATPITSLPLDLTGSIDAFLDGAVLDLEDVEQVAALLTAFEPIAFIAVGDIKRALDRMVRVGRLACAAGRWYGREHRAVFEAEHACSDESCTCCAHWIVAADLFERCSCCQQPICITCASQTSDPQCPSCRDDENAHLTEAEDDGYAFWPCVL